MFSPELRAKAEALVDRFPVKRSALLPLLHLVQHQDGFVSDDGVAECAELLDLTKAEVAAVSTFYTMYKREPMGEHLVSVCTNFSCAVRGGKATYDRLREHLGVGHDQTTEDGRITLEHAECLGNCEGAPVVTVDYLNYEWVDPDAAVELVEAVRAGNPPQPTRGMVPPGVRAASHRLAGIGPIDPEGPGQRLGLATKDDGAVPTPDAGVGSGTVGVISFGAAATPPASNGRVPDEVPAPEQDAGVITDPEPPAEPGDADVAEPADTDPQADPEAQPVADDTTTPDDADDSTIGEEEGIS
ncbi:NADH-quinone oxidoreductase subunit NuoE [Euzebya rosea]|uniref:NADH-quinone oxidoreductase subunit NuoE family protein n=1 Tax=Euzebya rosea TaxID=2052804 RepID=UPI00196B55A9|nr:NAD(P)H-dependent oxidoreductase subunit E [Euzebya rosea]